MNTINEDGHTGATATYSNLRSAINTLIEVGHDYDEIKSILESTLDELWGDDFEDEVEESLDEATDLSKIDGTMSNVLSEDDGWKYCDTAKEIYEYVKAVLDENGIDTKASRRLLLNISKKKSSSDAMLLVYNSILKGSGLGVVESTTKFISKNSMNESLEKMLNK